MKLNDSDQVRVIAPSRSMVILNEETCDIANETLKSLNLNIAFGNNVMKTTEYYTTASVKNRVDDLHNAFQDKEVKCILTAIGGYNLNQILPSIDYELIKNNPKIICGYSDITALLVAIYAKTGMITFHGPHYSSFGMKLGNEYTIKYFKDLLFKDKEIKIKSSQEYSDDAWYLNQEERKFIKNKGMKVINPGKAKGIIIGGNLCTLNLLQGTEFFPKIDDDIILFLEDDGASGSNFLSEFDRNLVSLMQTELFKQVKGLVLGRAQIESEMSEEKWLALVNKPELKNMPIIINADFGHTTPMFTFPIGGFCQINAQKEKIEIVIRKEKANEKKR